MSQGQLHVALGTLDPADSSVTHASDSAAHARGGGARLGLSIPYNSCSDSIPKPSVVKSRIASRPTLSDQFSAPTPIQLRFKLFGRVFVFVSLCFFACIPLNNVAILYTCSSRINSFSSVSSFRVLSRLPQGLSLRSHRSLTCSRSSDSSSLVD